MADAYAEADPRSTVVRETLFHVRCQVCKKLLAEMVSTPYRLGCPRCKAINTAPIPHE